MNCGKLFHLKIRFKNHQKKECNVPTIIEKKPPIRIKKSRKPEKVYKILQNPEVDIERIVLNASPYNILNSAEKKYSCETCKRCYVNYRDLVRHQRYMCDKEPQFACSFCDRKFYHRYRLTHHLLSLHPSHLA